MSPTENSQNSENRKNENRKALEAYHESVKEKNSLSSIPQFIEDACKEFFEK